MDSPPTPQLHDVADRHSGSAAQEQDLATPPLGEGEEDRLNLHPQDEAQRSQQPPLAEASVREPSSSSSAAPTPLAAALPRPRVTFADLPAELRDMIWEAALPEEPRVFNALVYASAGLRMQLLERGALRLPLAHVCAESRRAVRRAGYVLAFRDEDRPADPGVWFHPRRDLIERTIWGPGDFWGLKMPD